MTKQGAQASTAGAIIAVSKLPHERRAPISCRQAMAPAPPKCGMRRSDGRVFATFARTFHSAMKNSSRGA